MHKPHGRTLKTAELLKRFHKEGKCEGGDGRFSAFVQLSNGDLEIHSNGPDAGPNEQMFALDVLTYLNMELHHDGAWCIVFTHFATDGRTLGLISSLIGEHKRLAFLWVDKDGDVQFTMDCEQAIVWAMTEMTVHDWAGQCEAAWGLWAHTMRAVLDPQPNEMFKRAQGQNAPTVH